MVFLHRKREEVWNSILFFLKKDLEVPVGLIHELIKIDNEIEKSGIIKKG